MNHTNPTKKGNLRELLFGVVLMVIFSGALFTYGNKALMHDWLNATNVIPKKERFTELFIENHPEILAWQKEGVLTDVPLTFSFTIRNIEGVDKDYPYAAYITSKEGVNFDLKRGVVSIKNGESKTITETYIPASTTPQYKGVIYIELLEQSQSIHFSTDERK